MHHDDEGVDNNKLNKKDLGVFVKGLDGRPVIGYLDTNRRWNWEAW